ncbi:leucine-rich repeat domain-containing protein [Bacteroides sp. MSB163]|uniref:leucine-rich repeat domain-containing protein n=1 Tax=Bacteroides maternus TaxID=3117552 RepID=UPI002EDB591A
MKKIIIPTILFCLTMAAGCSQDEPAMETPDNGNAPGKQITVTAAMPGTGADTRLTYDDQTNAEGNGKLIVKWAASGEKIYLYNRTKQASSTLQQKASSLSPDGKNTEFTGNLPEGTETGDELYACYQHGLTDMNFTLAVVPAISEYIPEWLSLSIPDITSDGTPRNIKHTIFAKTTYQGESTVSFSFLPLTAALKLTIQGIPAGVTITGLQLSNVSRAADVDLTVPPLAYYSENEISMEKIENLSLTSSGNVFYTALVPDRIPEVFITATDSEGKKYVAALPTITIEAGNVYVAEVTLKDVVPDEPIDMDQYASAVEVKAAIQAILNADVTEIKLKGDLAKAGMGGGWGTFADNKQITKCDLTGVTGWGATPTLPDNAFINCTALQEVVLPDDVRVIGEYAFGNCSALTTVNLSQVVQIDKYAFQNCTSLAELTLDNVTVIDGDAFFGCTSLQTLKIPKCNRFDNYIVTGCNSLTRIEATAAGDFVGIDNANSIERKAVFHNRSTHSGDNAFNPANCDLVLNVDKKEDGSAVPKVSNGNGWTVAANASPMIWKSIGFQ